ncbi:MAG TPA: sensor histidine kinase, partial [Steroidobacter sp.]
AELARAGIGDERHADLRPDIEPMRLPTENGVSLALIVNELVMNALKHGRPSDRSPIIKVSLRRLEPGQARLTIADNGPGLGADASAGAAKPASGLGTRLISMLVRQLNGQLQVEHADGYAAHITFPLQPAATWDAKS